MQQDMNGLNFDMHYFPVSNQLPSSNHRTTMDMNTHFYHQQQQQQHQKQQQEQQQKQKQQQQQNASFEMLDWYQHNGVNHNYSMSTQPEYFPPTSSISPEMNMSSSPPCSMKHEKQNSSKQFEPTNTNFHPINNSFPPTPISDVMFPETPQTRNSVPSSVEPTTPHSDSNELSLSNAFATIDKWRLSTSNNQDNHYTKPWRQTKYTHDSSMFTIDLSDKSGATPLEAGYHLRKVAHNAIERRYRNNINDRIQALKNVVPALYKANVTRDKKRKKSKNEEFSDDEEIEGTGEFADGVEIAKKLNKATILHKATEYIHYLKYSNDKAQQENQLLQQILAQMPGGAKVLSRFLAQKQEFEKSEEQRIQAERKEAMEKAKIEHQNMLRERAAQRAALAELLPKKERRPYRRRNTTTKKTESQKPFLALFLCLAIASPLSFDNTKTHSHHEVSAITSVRLLSSSTSGSYWYWIKILGIFILFVYALLHSKCLSIKKVKKHSLNK